MTDGPLLFNGMGLFDPIARHLGMVTTFLQQVCFFLSTDSRRWQNQTDPRDERVMVG